ncbi:hypothetical protein [Thalassoporum mexicanum]|uniref:hypothetical protein n=1 Tax=Thalassoporum mexicanum TaxID=3457544 RepID=UPI0012EAD89F|nr:hypothetical protein [Pseudanabaena sp. PCC 7367]
MTVLDLLSRCTFNLHNGVLRIDCPNVVVANRLLCRYDRVSELAKQFPQIMKWQIWCVGKKYAPTMSIRSGDISS